MASIRTVLFLNWLPNTKPRGTLGRQVELVVECAIDLSSLSVLPQQPPENPLPSDPEDLSGHATLAGTLSLTEAGVASTPLCFSVATSSGARMHDSLSLHNETILDKFPNSSS